jgi:glucose-1-phosphatase
MIQGIRNIIFDLGGVVVNIDPERSYRQMSNLANIPQTELLRKINNDPLFEQFEKGLIDRNQLYNHVLSLAENPFNQPDFEKAWNAMIVDIPQKNLGLIKRLKNNCRVFALSNTNEIHIEHVNGLMQKHYGKPNLNTWFENVYLSFEVGMVKPHRKFFEFVLHKNDLNPSETLFIDDTQQHVEAAKNLGIQVMTVKPGRDIHKIFKFF